MNNKYPNIVIMTSLDKREHDRSKRFYNCWKFIEKIDKPLRPRLILD